MTNRLATLLKAARLKRGITIRAIEKESFGGITNGYVSRLENGYETQPSPPKLRVLCAFIGLDYVTALMAAGYINKKDLQSLRGMK